MERLLFLRLNRSGARVFLNGCRTYVLIVACNASSGARVFLNGCRTFLLVLTNQFKSGARVFLNGCRTCIAHIKLFFPSGARVFVWDLCFERAFISIKIRLKSHYM